MVPDPSGFEEPVQELESCLKGNGELLNDHTSAARRVDWMDRGCRGIKRLFHFSNREGGLRPELGWGSKGRERWFGN